MEPVVNQDPKESSEKIEFKMETLSDESPNKEIFADEKEKVSEKSSAEKDAAYNQILSKLSDDDDSDDKKGSGDVIGDAEKASQKTDAASQIQHLVDVASVKGVVHAVKVARHLEDNYVLDAFHDKLMADELHDALVKKGLLKNS